MLLALAMLPALWIAVYTVNYGRWAWKRQFHLGAIGLYCLAGLVLVSPALALWVNR